MAATVATFVSVTVTGATAGALDTAAITALATVMTRLGSIVSITTFYDSASTPLFVMNIIYSWNAPAA